MFFKAYPTAKPTLTLGAASSIPRDAPKGYAKANSAAILTKSNLQLYLLCLVLRYLSLVTAKPLGGTCRACLELTLQTRHYEVFSWTWVVATNHLHIQAIEAGTIVPFIHF